MYFAFDGTQTVSNVKRRLQKANDKTFMSHFVSHKMTIVVQHRQTPEYNQHRHEPSLSFTNLCLLPWLLVDRVMRIVVSTHKNQKPKRGQRLDFLSIIIRMLHNQKLRIHIQLDTVSKKTYTRQKFCTKFGTKFLDVSVCTSHYHCVHLLANECVFVPNVQSRTRERKTQVRVEEFELCHLKMNAI